MIGQLSEYLTADIVQAPVGLVSSLEEYLNDPNFEKNRAEYRENKRIADGGAPSATSTSAGENQFLRFLQASLTGYDSGKLFYGDNIEGDSKTVRSDQSNRKETAELYRLLRIHRGGATADVSEFTSDAHWLSTLCNVAFCGGLRYTAIHSAAGDWQSVCSVRWPAASNDGLHATSDDGLRSTPNVRIHAAADDGSESVQNVDDAAPNDWQPVHAASDDRNATWTPATDDAERTERLWYAASADGHVAVRVGTASATIVSIILTFSSVFALFLASTFTASRDLSGTSDVFIYVSSTACNKHFELSFRQWRNERY